MCGNSTGTYCTGPEIEDCIWVIPRTDMGPLSSLATVYVGKYSLEAEDANKFGLVVSSEGKGRYYQLDLENGTETMMFGEFNFGLTAEQATDEHPKVIIDPVNGKMVTTGKFLIQADFINDDSLTKEFSSPSSEIQDTAKDIVFTSKYSNFFFCGTSEFTGVDSKFQRYHM
jgi:hypothetical protein